MRALVQRRHLSRVFIIAMACVATLLVASAAIHSAMKPAGAAPGDDFVTTWNTSNPGYSNGTSILISTIGSGYSYDVDWNNDGVFDDFGVTGNITHDYEAPGTYTIRIRGSFPRIYMNTSLSDREKLVDIVQWGTNPWTSMATAFYGTKNLTDISATDTPNLSQVTNMSEMFGISDMQYADLSGWNVSNVTDMSGMFSMSKYAGLGLETWNVGNVTNMMYMFGSVTNFNGDVSGWDVSSATNIRGMFSGNEYFNADLSEWDVSNVTDMREMFGGATNFDSDLSGWDVRNVTNMSSMFGGVANFSADLSSWDVSKVTDFSYMFYNVNTMATDLSQWDVRSATTLELFYTGNQYPIGGGYDEILTAWAALPLQSGVVVGLPGWICSQDALVAKSYLVEEKGWQLPAETLGCNELSATGTSLGNVRSNSGIRNITISGVGFFEGAKVFIDGDEIEVTAFSSTSITVRFDASTITETKYVDVEVRNPGGFSSTLEEVMYFERIFPLAMTDVEVVTDEEGRRFMVITGTSMSAGSPILNDQLVPLCTLGSTFTREELSAGLDLPLGMVADTPLCMVFLEDNMPLENLSTTIRLWLPEDFDETVVSTFSINDVSIEYVKAGSPGVPAEVTAGVVGGDITQTPTIAARPTFAGKAEPGSTVTVTVYSDPISCSTTADSNGDWSCTLPSDLPAGNHTVYVRVTNLANEVTELGPYSVVVDGENPTVLAPNTGFVGNALAVVSAGQQINEKYPVVTWMVLSAALTLTGGMLVRNFATARSKK